GSERRVAWLGSGSVPGGTTSAPSNIQLQACVPCTANALVPTLDQNWFPSLLVLITTPPTATADLDDKLSLAWFELSLIFHVPTGPPAGFGALFRPDAPRRFRLTANGVEPGAILRIFGPLPADVAGGGQPTTIPTTADHPYAEFPIYPESASGALSWETAVETEPYILYGLLNGGPGNPAVIQTWSAPRTVLVDQNNNPMDPVR